MCGHQDYVLPLVTTATSVVRAALAVWRARRNVLVRQEVNCTYHVFVRIVQESVRHEEQVRLGHCCVRMWADAVRRSFSSFPISANCLCAAIFVVGRCVLVTRQCWLLVPSAPEGITAQASCCTRALFKRKVSLECQLVGDPMKVAVAACLDARGPDDERPSHLRWCLSSANTLATGRLRTVHRLWTCMMTRKPLTSLRLRPCQASHSANRPRCLWRR